MSHVNPSVRQLEIAVEIGQAIATARKARGWTQRELATELGLSLGSVKAWEIGRRLPGLAQRERLARLLAIDPDRLWVESCCPRCGSVWR